eukprot:scaffold81970_cov18-Prasinocladus_malaysianus.AAC.1
MSSKRSEWDSSSLPDRSSKLRSPANHERSLHATGLTCSPCKHGSYGRVSITLCDDYDDDHSTGRLSHSVNHHERHSCPLGMRSHKEVQWGVD